jgi:hypothetical protein
VVGVEVVSLLEIVAEVVEFAGVIVRLIAALVFEPLGFEAAIGWAVVVAGGGVEEDPVALADGEFAAGSVVDGGGADGRGRETLA